MELVFDRVTKQYKNKIAVDRLSMKLTRGVYGLLGANGAGKTTLMRMMCGILRPDSGEILLDGKGVNEEEYREQLGYLPQDFGYYPDFTAMDFMMYMASLKGIPRKKAKEKSLELLETVNLEHMAKKKIKTFSGGMKQRLGIAQAVLNNPKVLVLDEPTAGLDPKERIRFRSLISDLSRDKIVILSTHIVSDVEYIADQILMMKKGRLILSGHPAELVERASGMAWMLTVPEEAVGFYERNACICNLRHTEKGVELRIVADEKPAPEAVSAATNLEDLYMFYFAEELSGASSDSTRRT